MYRLLKTSEDKTFRPGLNLADLRRVTLRFNMFIVLNVMYTSIHSQGLGNDTAPPWWEPHDIKERLYFLIIEKHPAVQRNRLTHMVLV